MIGWLHGHIVDKQQPGKFVIDVNGVGYDVETSLQTFCQLESVSEKVGLHIHTIVREDALLLYGFLQLEERSLFRALIKINGVGPKLAIAILSSMGPGEFIQCIKQQNAALLAKLPGIGKKTAERLVMEMKDSIDTFSISNAVVSLSLHDEPAQEHACQALESLGYKRQEALKAIKKIDYKDKSCEQLIREALQLLSRAC